MSFASYIKSLDTLVRALRPLAQNADLSDMEHEAALDKALSATKVVDLNAIVVELQSQIDKAKDILEAKLSKRREDLLMAAHSSGIPNKRFSEYDFIGPFKISYKGRKVQIDVGSERVMDVYEPDGTRLFNIIKMKESALNEEELSREEFFSLLKESMTLAKIRGLNRDGRTPVRKLYPLFVLARQCRSEVFLSKPDAKNFRDYQTFHFVYDLARFGREGWRCGDEILRTQTPNMATISKGETMMLPALDLAEGSGHQIAVLWIEKREET